MGDRAWARMIAVAIAVIVLDQITKALVEEAASSAAAARTWSSASGS